MLLNPGIVIDGVTKIIDGINDDKKEFRQENDPLIRSALHDAV
jgi:hypothetical protein